MKRSALLGIALLGLGCTDKKGPLLIETAPNTPTTVAPAKPADAPLSPPAEAQGLPAGAYTIDHAHASFVLRVDHLGFSNYSMRFNKFDAQMQLDPMDPTKALLTASVDPASLELNSPPTGFLNQILGPQYLDAKKFPAIAFKSTAIELAGGGERAHITGDLTLHGVTKPVTLDAKFNGGWAGIPPDPHARIGFSARGALKRSDFGITTGLPAPGTKMGVGDEVEMFIEAEFTGPDWKPPATQAQH